MKFTQHRRMVAVAAIAVTGVVAIPATASAAGHNVVEEGESIQEAIDAAGSGATIVVEGHHVENVWIDKSNIRLVGRGNASIELPDEPTLNPCTGQNPEGEQVDSVVCVFPPDVEPGTPPWEIQHLRNVAIKGLTITGATLTGIDVYFTDNVTVKDNHVGPSGCEGIFVLFADGFKIQRNVVEGSQFCDGITAPASENGRITNNWSSNSAFAGIAALDTSNVVISKNHVTGNCFGIVAVNNPDFPLELPSNNVRIVQNTANGNNTICYPFDPPGVQTIPAGVTGILAVGTDRVVIERNTASDNVTDEFSVTAAGILVRDTPGENPADPPYAPATRTRVNKNTAFGNSSAAGPVDLWLDATGGFERVKNNKCDHSTPDASWCTG